jgi:hypothetical protein
MPVAVEVDIQAAVKIMVKYPGPTARRLEFEPLGSRGEFPSLVRFLTKDCAGFVSNRTAIGSRAPTFMLHSMPVPGALG